MICISLDFLWICLTSLWCNTKFHQLIVFGVLGRGLQSNYRKLMRMDLQSCLLGSLTLFHITQFGVMMRWGWWGGKSLSMLDYPNTWNSRNKAWKKLQLMQWRWICMWIIKKIFYCIYQNLCLLKGLVLWKDFGLPVIRNWIMRELSCCPQGRLLIKKTRSFVLIVGPKTWS